MITRLIINNIATYTQKVEIEPTEINYFYGSNGSGKTALSKVIANVTAYPDCCLHWQTNPIKIIAYNKDFVEEYFSQSSSIKGIFTLGKDATEAKMFIESAKQELDDHTAALKSLYLSLEQKKTQEEELTDNAIDKCWSIKDKYQDTFREAYTGFIGSKKKFFEKCQQEQGSILKLLDWNGIKEKCNQVFSTSLQSYEQIPQLDVVDLSELENNEILTTKIVGKEDVPIGALISKLNNSDWVKQGVGYLEQSENQCPFCQQAIRENLKSEIEAFFDETYALQCNKFEDYRATYTQMISEKIETLKKITEKEIEILNFSALTAQIELIEEKFKNNLTIIEGKIKFPSSIIQLESLISNFQKVQEIIQLYRTTIERNNNTAKNIRAEKKQLIAEIWLFIANELSTDLTTYQKTLSGIQTGKKSIQDKINEREAKKKTLESQIKNKEADVTSVIHTKNEINKILKSFGFTNFRISEAGDGYYKIIRQNGMDAKETLSEGEYTFITFLYFYQLLKGNTHESGLATDKIIVIDDPISSLDSNVLFIVSNLIKDIIKDYKNKCNGIKQVFILTHNIYFHKEVTFKGSRQGGKWSEESFWIVRNLNTQSNIIKHDENPIQATYELLWREIKDIEQINKATIFNTFRRILEYYFNIIGGLDYEKIINDFDGEDKIIFKSLISWINDGSHFINDDLLIYAEPESIEKQLKVFKEIFVKMGHESHYNMMMKVTNAK
jgi:wobble nucleotide-excising tRNase